VHPTTTIKKKKNRTHLQAFEFFFCSPLIHPQIGMNFVLRGTTRGNLLRNVLKKQSRQTFVNDLKQTIRHGSSVAITGGVATILKSEDLTFSSKNQDHLSKLQLNSAILNQVQQHIEAGEQNAFFVVDASAIEERFKLWTTYLPDVRPYYAVKCNPDPFIIETLARLGCGFDCASSAEIDAVLSYGADPLNDVIYANPCKQPSHIAYSASRSVDIMTFDSQDEVDKIKSINPNAKLVLRLYVDDTKALCRLGTKFGAMVHDAPEILAHAKAQNMDVIGVSFHVGSGCTHGSAYSDAVARARNVFDIGYAMGFNFDLLDIGGGFPGTASAPVSFEDCAKALQKSLAEHFPTNSGVRVISEPGRFFAASSHTLVVNVIGRKIAPTFDVPGAGPSEISQGPSYMYFVNDGLYGSFNGLVFDQFNSRPVVVSDKSTTQEQQMFSSSIWGPTCDGMDCIMKDVQMPRLEIGQWLCFPAMGAYSNAAASHFNGFAPPQKLYMDSREIEYVVKTTEQEQFVH
jgi:ornithine decarboxylase